MSELTLLRVLLLASMAIGPLGTHHHLFPTRWRYATVFHLGALACAAIGLFTRVSTLTIVWLAFTSISFARFLHARRSSLLSPGIIAACVPFLFSNVAALWLVGGSNELRILGYGEHFSYYAALHGNVLGWSVLGSFAILASAEVPRRGVYVAAVLVCFPSFLLIAFGIDQLRPLKLAGIVGFSLALPIAYLTFLVGIWRRDTTAFVLAVLSFAGLVVTMLLAWRNELAMSITLVAGIRDMVSLHGVLNTLVVAPCLLAAVARRARR